MSSKNKLQIYAPLTTDREIRLVHLLPGDKADDLVCEVQHAGLDDIPSYECLSYRWGHDKAAAINLGGDARLELNENLINALRFLRQQDTTRVLWADQICINQVDNKEKMKQVELMGEICQSASRVIAWLGLADDKTPSTFEFLSSLYSSARNNHIREMTRNKEMGIPDALVDNKKLLEELLNEHPTSLPQWKDVQFFLGNEWFSRVWIVQEIVLAKQVRIQCSDFTLPWAVMTFLGPLMMERPKNDPVPIRDAADFMLELVRAKLGHHVDHESASYLLSLIALLRDMRPRNATDPRDKVFALLNVATDNNVLGLKPDYTTDWPEAYTKTSRRLLTNQKGLSFLKLVEVKAKMESRIPSWVPDFRSHDYMNFLYQPRMIIRKTKLYCSAGNTQAIFRDVNDPNLLAVRGLYVGTLKSVSEPPGNLLGNVALGQRVLDGGEWSQFAYSWAKNGLYGPTGESILAAYARLRAGDCVGRLGSNVKERPLAEDYPSPGEFTFDANADGLLRGDRDDIGMIILCQTTRRRMFFTDTGYMGLTHRSNQVGDKVFVLLGGDMPFVLRPKGDRFLFRGEAYVHGIMDGEALTKARQRADPSWTPTTGWFEELRNGSLPFDTEEIILE